MLSFPLYLLESFDTHWGHSLGFLPNHSVPCHHKLPSLITVAVTLWNQDLLGFLPLDNDSTALWWFLMSSGNFDSRTVTNTVPYKSAWMPILCNPLIWTSVPWYSFRSFPMCFLLHTGINFNNIFMWALTIYFSSLKRFFKSSIVGPYNPPVHSRYCRSF